MLMAAHNKCWIVTMGFQEPFFFSLSLPLVRLLFFSSDLIYTFFYDINVSEVPAKCPHSPLMLSTVICVQVISMRWPSEFENMFDIVDQFFVLSFHSSQFYSLSRPRRSFVFVSFVRFCLLSIVVSLQVELIFSQKSTEYNQ